MNKRPSSSLQVLPSEGGADSWPFVIGRLLFAVFGGRDTAIRQLYLSGGHDQIPDDIIECWATCYWCFHACLNAPVSEKERARISQHLEPVAAYAYRMTLPTKAELFGDGVMTVTPHEPSFSQSRPFFGCFGGTFTGHLLHGLMQVHIVRPDAAVPSTRPVNLQNHACPTVT